MTWGYVAVAGATVVSGALSAQGAKKSANAQNKGLQKGVDAQLQMFREGQEATAPWRATGERALGALSDIYGVGSYSTQQEQDDLTRYNELQGIISKGKSDKANINNYNSALSEMETLGPQVEAAQAKQQAAGEKDPYASFFGMQDKLRAGFDASPGQEYQLAEAEKAAKRQLSAQGFSGSGAEMKELQRIAQGQASQEWGNYMGQFGDYTDALRSMAGQGQTSAGQTSTQSSALGSNLSSNYRAMGAAAAQQDISTANIYGNVLEQGAKAYGMYKGMDKTQAPVSYQPMAGSPYGLQPGYGYA